MKSVEFCGVETNMKNIGFGAVPIREKARVTEKEKIKKDKPVVKIIDVRERVLVKKTIDIEVNGELVTVYIVNGVVNGIYRNNIIKTKGLVLNQQDFLGRGLKFERIDKFVYSSFLLFKYYWKFSFPVIFFSV